MLSKTLRPEKSRGFDNLFVWYGGGSIYATKRCNSLVRGIEASVINVFTRCSPRKAPLFCCGDLAPQSLVSASTHITIRLRSHHLYSDPFRPITAFRSPRLLQHCFAFPATVEVWFAADRPRERSETHGFDYANYAARGGPEKRGICPSEPAFFVMQYEAGENTGCTAYSPGSGRRVCVAL